jgi:hypothetical protein
MKKLFVASLILFGTAVCAQTVNLACQGSITTEFTSKHRSLNYKDKKDWIRFNVVIEPSTNSLTIGPSYHTTHLTYPNLRIDESSYAVNYSASNPNPDHTYNSLNFYLDRYTGNFKLSSRADFKSGGILENKSTGDCQIGVHWQTKF